MSKAPSLTDVPITRGRSLLTAAQHAGNGGWFGSHVCGFRGEHDFQPITMVVNEHIRVQRGAAPPMEPPADASYAVQRCRRCGALDRAGIVRLVTELDPSLADEALAWSQGR